MKNQIIQQAVMCLQILDEAPDQGLSAKTISQEQGIPFDKCRSILARLEAAGIVSAQGPEVYRLEQPLEQIKALDLLEAVWAPTSMAPEFKVLFGSKKGRGLKCTLQAANKTAIRMPIVEG